MTAQEESQVLAAPRTSRGFMAAAGRILALTVRSPAAWLFAGVWLASALVLVLAGQGFPTLGLLMAVAYLLFSLLTVVMTEPAPHAPPATVERTRIWLQTGIVLLFVVLTTWRGMAFHNVAGADSAIPLWSPMVGWLERTGGRWFGNDNFVANPVVYFVLPLLLLLLAGARLPELGFGRGHRVGRVLLLWCAIPAVFLAFALLTGQLVLGRLLRRLTSNFMQNGFFEEFLFRGALQTRLARLWRPDWALVVQALLFGAWHLGLGYTNTGHAGFLPALASTIVYQAVMGLAMGVLFARTRNLAAPSVVHIVTNSLG